MKALIYAALLLLPGAVFAQAVATEATQASAQPSAQAVAADAVPADSEVGALLGYTSAVQLHLEKDPVLAATYLTFWNALANESNPAALDEAAASRLLASSELVNRALRKRFPQSATSYRLADTLAVAVSALSVDRDGSKPEELLAAVDRLIAPRLEVNGRYEYAGTLQGPADLAVGADLWLLCRVSSACAEAHDKLFGKALAGVPLAAGLPERLERDTQLRGLPELAQLTVGILGLDNQLRNSRLKPRDAAAAAARGYLKSIGAELKPVSAAAGSVSPNPSELQVLLELGRASAWLAGSEQLANSFEVVGPPLLDYSRLVLQGGGGFLAATAGVGLLVAGVQALSLSDTNETPPPELNQLIDNLYKNTYRNFVGLRAESMLASNSIDTRLVRLGLTLDVVRDDVERIETGQRARVRADFLVQDARRWTDFEEDNDRCFSLRSMDPKSGRLRPSDFRRCEDNFLQGAVRRAQYLNQAQDYLLDARYIEPDDLRFPFHHHYPLLLTQAGVDRKTALGLVDPYAWQQQAAALLRLYQENPADAGEYARRADALRTLRTPGVQINDALDGLVLTRGGAPAFRTALHQQALDAYFTSLRSLVSRVGVLDDPEADRYGKRLTRGLDQPLPGGRRLAAIEAVLSNAKQGETKLRACSDAADEQFLAPGSGLAVESRGFFNEPISAAELARSWNRDAIANFDFAPESWAPLVPRPYLWAALDGHGELEICLATMRPAAVEFSREEASLSKHLRGNVRLEADLEVRFIPGAGLMKELALPASPVVVARYQATRACSFAYRNDDEGCSRGQCLAELAPQFWSSGNAKSFDGGSCSGESLQSQLSQQNVLADDEKVTAMADALSELYWSARAERSARLLADAARSREYENASVLYLQYFALAGTTLGTWPDPSAPLAPLFADENALTPRAVLQKLIDERKAPAAMEVEIDAVRTKVLKKVNARGGEVARGDARYRLPQLGALRETLSRIDMMLAGYQS